MTELLNTDWEKDRKIFLESFPGFKTFQTFPDNKDLKSKTNLTRQVSIKENVYPSGDFDFTKPVMDVNIIVGLEKLNELGAGVYLTINETDGRGRKTENITKIRSCFADLDEVSLPKSFEERPSMIVETSPGKHHIYYFTVLDDDHYGVPLKACRPLQESIAKKFGGDPVVKDLPRILRISGFFHNKKEPFMSRVVDYTGTRFDFGLLCELFPPIPVPQWSAPKYQPDKGVQTGEFKGAYGSSKGNRNCDLAKIIGGMLSGGRDWGYIENECFKHNSYSHPPLPEGEVRAVLKSCGRYA